MKRLINFLMTILVSSSLFTSCAMLSNGTRQDVHVVTEPAGATVYDGDTTSQTPVTLNLARQKDHTITIAKAGYEIEKVTVQRKLSPKVAGNIVMIGGAICMVIDAASGAMWDLDPNTVTIDLKSVDKSWYETFLSNAKKIFTLDSENVDDQDAMKDITVYFLRNNKNFI